MKNKGFTLIELLVVITIVAAVAMLVFGIVHGVNNSEEYDSDVDYTYFAPEIETARSQRRMAEEMQRQNDLLQRRLELLEEQVTEKR